MSTRLWYMNTQGMETPLVLLLMVSSWYATIAKRYLLAGFLAGLLLWTRIDSAIWVLALLVAMLGARPYASPRFALAAATTYLPWLVFATLYFGSPIPHTMTAKWVAYIASSRTSFPSHLTTIARYLSPVDLSASTERVAPVFASITIALACFGALRAARNPSLRVLCVFVVVDALTLALAGVTFFNRYLVPILWATLILAGMTLGTISQRLAASSTTIRILGWVLLLTFGSTVALITPAGMAETKRAQVHRNDASLKAIGLWLNARAPRDATVLLEPLGYVGYYSNRHMFDAVGLVTPSVVELKRLHVGADRYPLELEPDYVVVHCDDESAIAVLSDALEFGKAGNYMPLRVYDPLDFRTSQSDIALHSGDARAACYQVWGRILP
jgi:hypothetical protein